MLVDNKNFREAEHIGEEMLNGIDLAMDSKCRSVERTLSDGVFTLEKALKLYKVPKETYFTYVAKKHAQKINSEISSASGKEHFMSAINIFEKMIFISFAPVMDISEFAKILDDFKNVSAAVEKGRISLKEKVTLK
ncbi:hypothetical protein ACPPVU_09575 [Mucilaginibacter sp. McL0603]|uniref:hypothetical protein n=1 Tax=Mucilaginibacter sp. McL0603 TaxID=3415670 RepID=UPI003CFB4107